MEIYRGGLRSAYDMTAQGYIRYEKMMRARRISSYEADRIYENVSRSRYALLNELRSNFPYSIDTLDNNSKTWIIPDEAAARAYQKKVGQFMPDQYGDVCTNQHINLQFCAYMVLWTHMIRSGFAHLVKVEELGIPSFMKTGLSFDSDVRKARAYFLGAAQKVQPFSETGAKLDEKLVLKILEASPSCYNEIDDEKRERAIVHLLDNCPYGFKALEELSQSLGKKYTEEQIIRAEIRSFEGYGGVSLDRLKRAEKILPENASWQAYGLTQTQNYAAQLTNPYHLEAARGVFGFSPSPEQMEQVMRHYLSFSIWGRNLKALYGIMENPPLSEQTAVYGEIGARCLASTADRMWQIERLKTDFNYRASLQEILDVADRLVERIKNDPGIMHRGLD